jgi:hypothetical protein
MSGSAGLAAQAVPVEIGPRVAVHPPTHRAWSPARRGAADPALRADRYIDDQLDGGPDPS